MISNKTSYMDSNTWYKAVELLALQIFKILAVVVCFVFICCDT